MTRLAMAILWLFMTRAFPMRVRFAAAHARDLIRHPSPIRVKVDGTDYGLL